MNLDTIVDFITKYQPIFYGIGLLIWCFIILIDNINVTQLERKLMTPKSIFMYYFSQVFLMSIFTLAILFLFSEEGLDSFYNTENNEIQYSMVLLFLIVIMIFYSVIVFCVRIMTALSSINFKYYIVLEDGQKWNIVRMNKNKSVLVERVVTKETEQRFIFEPFNKNYIKELIISDNKIKLLKWIEKNKILIIILSLTFLGIIVTSIFLIQKIPIVAGLFFIFGTVCLLIIVAFKFASLDYETIALEMNLAERNSSD